MKYDRSKFLMGTNINIVVFGEKNALEDIYNTFGIFSSIEMEFSRFINISDLSTLNYKKELEVSDRFIDVLELSKQVNIKTNNYFNPLVNISNIGYGMDFKEGIFEKKNTSQNLDLDEISIIGNHISLKPDQNLDLGGIVKGYCVDLASNYLKSKGYRDFIINAGGDIFISGKTDIGEIPTVAIDSPFDSKEIFATIDISNKSISTSGTYKRNWNIDKKNFHHILDPKSNENNNEIISITLISDKCYISDSYATSCIAMGIKRSIDFLEINKIPGIIIGSDGNIYKTSNISDYDLVLM